MFLPGAIVRLSPARLADSEPKWHVKYRVVSCNGRLVQTECLADIDSMYRRGARCQWRVDSLVLDSTPCPRRRTC